jgi:Tfp pilus assembly protein PilV
MKNENGISILEILTASGLAVGISALALSQLQATADSITAKGAIIQQQNQATADQIQNILNGN